MLNSYLAATSNLLQNPGAPNPLYSSANLTTYINTARGQLAGEAQCIRAMGTISLAAATQAYAFSQITIASQPAILGVLNVRTVWLQGGPGLAWMTPVSFEEFSLYEMTAAVSERANPTTWAQYGQGASGSVFFSPVPGAAATAQLDCVCLPSPLSADGDPEAIPYLWTDAVPYFAAYLALLSAQTGVRTADADKMLQRYTEFVGRARRASTSAILPWAFEQTAVPGGLNATQQAPGGQ